ncbi:MAG: acyl-ACP--UDP-N-acetylglucosamine O-acyltransferase [Planctomycetaceae bacterium]
MSTIISPLAHVEPGAVLGENVTIGPFCLVGSDVVLGDGCRLDSHVSITGKTTIGSRNRFWPGSVIGAEPQDTSYNGADTELWIGDDNQFREGVTVNRGAEKEDGITRIGNRNMLMSNAHVAHNCHVYDDTVIVNGVLLGGHVHVHDRACISGNSVVHHFTTVGRLAFVGGGSRVVRDVPPFMLAFGAEGSEVKNINLVGMQRAGMGDHTIACIRKAYRALFREYQKVQTVRETLAADCGGTIPIELAELFAALERQSAGKMGRAREVFRNVTSPRPDIRAAS